MRKILLLAVSAAALWAAPLTVTASGTFNAATSSTPYFGPNKTWSLSFNIASNPMVLSYNTGQYSQVAISNVVYLLNGVQTYAGNNTMYIYTVQSFDLCLDPNCSYGLAGFVSPQLYSGPEASPTILPGMDTSTGFNAYYFPQGQGTSVISPQSNIAFNIVADPIGTPVPSSLYLALIGLTALTFYLTARRRVA
jgi:hypothetical protein